MRAEVAEHEGLDEVAHDGVLVLEVVVEAKALGGEVLPDRGHAEVGAVLPAKLAGCSI